MEEIVKVKIDYEEKVKYSRIIQITRKEFEEFDSLGDSELEHKIHKYLNRNEDWQDSHDFECTRFEIERSLPSSKVEEKDIINNHPYKDYYEN